jgi:hypothetical protein
LEFSQQRESWNKAVCIATGFGLDGREVVVRFPAVAKFSNINLVHTVSGAHPAYYAMGTGDSFPEVKWSGREADYSPPTSAEVKKVWIYTSTLTYAFMV